MGSEMTLLFAEHDLRVSLFDIVGENVDHALQLAEENPPLKDKIKGFKDYDSFMKSFDESKPKLLLLSITHGHPADEVLEALKKFLKKGDIILDGGNEWYKDTERRQTWLKKELGVDLIGMGVSGGYQSARRGPSISPGGDKQTIDKLMPLFEKFAAKDEQYGPCVTNVGPAGAGHYVKMIHNGIEQ
ncbi:unnamed protein product, partial [Didymodactylos carnosus]